MNEEENKKEDMNLFLCVDEVIYLKGPFKNFYEVDAYMKENIDKDGFIYFCTTEGEMRFETDELTLIDNPDWEKEVIWV